MPAKMDITLTRKINVSCIDVILDIGRSQKRSDLIAVLMRTKELGGRITPEDICNSLFIDRPLSFGKTIIQRCRDYGLIDSFGTITKDGLDALGKERVFAPEEGRFRMTITDDPLLPSPIIDLSPMAEPDIQWSIDGRKRDGKDSSHRPTKRPDAPTPRWIKNLEGQDLYTLRDWEEIRLFHVGDWCMAQTNDQKGAPRVTWVLPFESQPALNYSWGSSARELEPPQMPFNDVFANILGGTVQNDWLPGRGVMRKHFDGLSDEEIRTFSTSIQVKKPQLPGLGEFETTTIRGIPIFPKTNEDAQQWAMWLLRDRVKDFLDDEGYRVLAESVLREFPNTHIALPSRQELARSIRADARQSGGRLPKAYWYLQTLLDLDVGEVKI